MAGGKDPILSFAIDMDLTGLPSAEWSVVEGETENLVRIARENGGEVLLCPAYRTSTLPVLTDPGQVAEWISIAAAPHAAGAIFKQGIKSIGAIVESKAARKITVKYKGFEITASSIAELTEAIDALRPLLDIDDPAPGPEAAPRKKKAKKTKGKSKAADKKKKGKGKEKEKKKEK